MGDCQTDDPPFPLSRLVSKHTHSVRRSPIWGRKKSLILGMCSGPPRNYNQINRQAGCPQRLPPSQSGPAFLLLLATVLGAMDRDSFVLLILPLGLLVLEPVLVLLAVEHGTLHVGITQDGTTQIRGLARLNLKLEGLVEREVAQEGTTPA